MPRQGRFATHFLADSVVPPLPVLDAARPARQASRVKYCNSTVKPAASTPLRLLLAILGLAITGSITGCAAKQFDATSLGIPLVSRGMSTTAPPHFDPDEAAETESQPDPRTLPMFLGDTGEVISWSDVRRAILWADVIMVGEEHDDGVGHAVQRAVMEDVAERFDNVALSMEMLERDEQRVVDDFLEDIIDAEDFAKLTNSEKWAGEGSWENWYQPIIDVAKADGGRVIAANAPRRYVRLARSQGFERLRALPRERRELVEFPRGSLEGPYRDRFVALMSDMPDEDAADPHAHRMPSEAVLAMFRSQITWDATMAGSIDKALRRGASKIVHLAGRFHIGYEGGTVTQFERRNRGARVLTIVMSKDDALELRDDDRGLADIVIYTGKRPEPEEEAAEEEAETDDVTAEPSPVEDDPESQSTDPPNEPDAR